MYPTNCVFMKKVPTFNLDVLHGAYAELLGLALLHSTCPVVHSCLIKCNYSACSVGTPRSEMVYCCGWYPLCPGANHPFSLLCSTLLPAGLQHSDKGTFSNSLYFVYLPWLSLPCTHLYQCLFGCRDTSSAHLLGL